MLFNRTNACLISPTWFPEFWICSSVGPTSEMAIVRYACARCFIMVSCICSADVWLSRVFAVVFQRYRMVFCDEYQDIDTEQFRLVMEICREHQNITVCGDDDQSVRSLDETHCAHSVRAHENCARMLHVDSIQNRVTSAFASHVAPRFMVGAAQVSKVFLCFSAPFPNTLQVQDYCWK